MLYKMDNATFSGDIPSLPQWTGAPRAMIQAQAILYASLAASLFSAFLAMLGKQWLNRYASTDMRGSGMERSRDRQRKLDGIIAWYFDHVMESLPLMLQVALLLFGCALSRYLLHIHVTIACVVLGVTAFGVIFHIFFVIAGTTFANCPYQTPCARILCHIFPPIIGQLHSVYNCSASLLLFSGDLWGGWRDWEQNIQILLGFILSLPLIFAYDTYQLARAMVMALIAHARGVPSWIRSARSSQTHGLDQRAAALDSQCVSWILQTSLEKGVRLSTLKFLGTTPTLVGFNPALLSDCFGILIDCVKVNEGNPAIVQGMEKLAEVSAMCFFLTYSHLSIMDPMPGILLGIRQHYKRIFPLDLDFSDLPFPHTLRTIHEAIYSDRGVNMSIEWRSYEPPNHEHVVAARALSKLSWFEYRRRKPNQVPPPCLSFSLHYLSQDSLPPPSVIADCLLIIAIDLGCNVRRATILGERCVRVWRIYTTLLTKIQCTTRGDF